MTSILRKIEDDLNSKEEEEDLNYNITLKVEDHLSLLLRNAVLASPSFSWAWHSSAPACLFVIAVFSFYDLKGLCLKTFANFITEKLQHWNLIKSGRKIYVFLRLSNLYERVCLVVRPTGRPIRQLICFLFFVSTHYVPTCPKHNIVNTIAIFQFRPLF